jgi:cyclopropane fatty-acyl-phospholipid synthase-like methyltransferase
MKYVAEKYGITVTGVTVSREQADLGRKIYAGLPHVEIYELTAPNFSCI